MSIKWLYRKIMFHIENLPGSIMKQKVFLAEWYDIFRKRKLYKDIKWTKQQQFEFDMFWKSIYGKKISSRWHKLYQSINGVFNVQYIPEIIYTTKMEPRGNRYLYAKVFSDKTVVELLTKDSPVVVPKTIVACVDGVLRDHKYEILDELKANQLIVSEDRIVLKPTLGGSSGKGVEVLRVSEERDISFAVLKKKYGNNFIIQKAIEPNTMFQKLHPESINTIRIISYLTKDSVKVAPVSMRIGTGNANVDNIHSGGLVVAVSNEGKLSKYAYELGYCDCKTKYEIHPDSKIVFEGYQIPYIPNIIENAKNMHLKLSHIQFVSWDYTVNAENEIVLIEVNLLGQSVWFPQIVSGKGLFAENSEDNQYILKEIFKSHR